MFVVEVFGGLARLCCRSPAVSQCATTGDGIFLVIDDIEATAECVLHLQDAFAALDLANL